MVVARLAYIIATHCNKSYHDMYRYHQNLASYFNQILCMVCFLYRVILIGYFREKNGDVSPCLHYRDILQYIVS